MKKNIEGIIKFLEPEFVFGDQRGKLRQLVSSGWSQINFINSLPGSIRGGHYHKNNREMFFVISGKFNLVLKKDDSVESFLIEAEDMFVIEKNVSHSFEYLEETSLISMYDLGVEEKPNGKKDIYRDE